MTAQSSTNKFFKYYVYRLGRLKFLIMLLMFFMLLTFPLYSLFLEGYASETLSRENIGDTCQSICQDLGWKIFAAGTAGALVVMLIIGLEGFRYLHKKKFVNMDMSLPVTHRQRFFGDLLAVVTAYFGPVFIACITGAGVSAHVKSLDYSYFFPNGGRPSYLISCANLEILIPMFIVGTAMLLAMSLFVISFCGRTPVAVIMTVLVQVAIPLTTFSLWIIGISGAYGASDNYIMDTSVMSLLSPIGYLIAKTGGELHRLLNCSPWGYIFIAVYIATLIAGAYFVQKHRRNERTGEPFVYKYARHTFTTLFILALISLFFMRVTAPEYVRYTFLNMLLPDTPTVFSVAVCVIAVIAVFVTMEVIGGGKLKKAPAAAARFLVTAGASFGLCMLMPATGCFGYVTYIPSPDEADRAEISFYNFGDYNNSFYVPYEEAAALHKRILEERPGGEKKPYSHGNLFVRIDYTHNGTFIEQRVYELDESYVRDMYEMYFRNSGFKWQYQNRYRGDGTYNVRNEDGQWVEVQRRTESFAFLWKTKVIPVGKKNDEEYMLKSDVDVDELLEAIIEDAGNVTFEQYYLSAYKPPKYINIRRIYYELPTKVTTSGVHAAAATNYYDDQLKIYPFFTKSVALLKEHGIDLFPDTQDDYAEYSAFLVKAEKNAEYGKVENTLSMMNHNTGIIDDHSSKAMHRLTGYSDEIRELMNYTAERTYYEGDVRYYIWFAEGHYGDAVSNMLIYPVTEANAARAAEIWASLPEAREELENLRDHSSIFSLEEIEEYDRKRSEQQ